MAKVLLFMVLAAISPAARGVAIEPTAVERWFERLPHAKEKVTKLHFYFHEIESGKRPDTAVIAQPKISDDTSYFGILKMADDALRVGPELNSTVVGRAQGMYGIASFTEVALFMTFNFVFTEGKYKGSTLSLLGRNAIYNEYREMPIVGGSGVFRLARGVATVKTYMFNVTSGDAIVEYNVVVLHY